MKVSKRSFVVVVIALVAALGPLSAASAQGPVTDVSTAGPANLDAFTDKLVRDLTASGFEINPGYPMKLGPDFCQSYTYPALGNCFGNNPAGTYAIATVKAWPHEHAGPSPANVLGPVQPGYIPVYRLGPRDAIVLYGQMPPPGKYIGWSTYEWTQPGRWQPKLYDQVASMPNLPLPLQYTFNAVPPNDPNPRRIFSFSSLGDIVNNVVMERKSGDPWGKNRYFITTPSKSTDAAVRRALHAQGVPDGDIFTEPIPSRDAYGPIGPLGMGKEAIDFFSMFRYALPDDPVAAGEWWKALPLAVLRVRAPSSLGPVEPYGMLTYEKQTTPNPEGYLAGDMEDLVDAVCERTSSILGLESGGCAQPPPASSLFVSTYTDYGWTGPYCRELHIWCGDQNDMAASLTRPLPLDSGQVYAVVDTLATETGNATYVGLGVNDASTFLAPTGVTDAELKGSADQYAATVNNTGMFFVHYFTRDCKPLVDKHVVERAQDCTSITTEMVPAQGSTAPGDPALHGMTWLGLRDYVAPGTARGPDDSKLLRARVLSFTQP